MNVREWVRSIRDTPAVLRILVAVARGFQRVGWTVPERVFRHLPYRGMVNVTLPNGKSFQMESQGGAIENGLYWQGLFAHEPESMRRWLAYAEKARCVLDIGANSGVFGLAAAASGAGEIHAFEPLPRVHAILESNLRKNSFQGIQAWPLAVGNTPGMAELFDPGIGSDAPTSASLSAQFAREHFGDLPRILVEVVTIDQFCARIGIAHVDLIKLDVEGFEEQALLGMQGILLRDKPIVLMEVLPEYEARLTAVVRDILSDSYLWQKVHEGDQGPDRNVLLIPVDA